MTRPVHLFGTVRLHLYGPDTTTDLGTVAGIDGSGKHSKRYDECTLSFTGSELEAVVDADETVLEDAFAVPEVWYDGDWLPFGTPYLLAPGSGNVIGSTERRHTPVGTSALHGLLEECVVLPKEADPDHATFKHAGGIEQNLYVGWMSKGFTEGDGGETWHDADVYDPTGEKKENKPKGWEDADAEWVFRDADEGSVTLFRIGTFTLADDQRVVFESVSDENHKVYLDGPNHGGVIIDFQADEDGFNQGVGHFTRRLAAGTYRVSAEMRTVDSEGGDGNDSFRFTCWSVLTDGTGDRDAFLLRTDGDTRVLRLGVNDERPGMSIGETIRRLLQENDDLADAPEAAGLLLAARTFTDTEDTSETAWPDGKEWVWPLGTTLGSAFIDLLGDCDLDMGPDFTFNAWGDRASDLSATVELIPGGDPATAGMNIVSYDYDSEPAGPNGYLTLSQDGFTLVTPSITGTRRRLGYLESGSSPSIARARKFARDQIDQTGREPRRFYRAQILAVADAVPYVDFELCDVIHGRGYRNLGLDLEVTSMSWEQGEATLFSLEMAEPVT